jgi:adenylate kinase
MDAGQLLPDDIMLGVIEERLGRPDAAGGWLLDGFPRTPGQAEGLMALLGDSGADLAIDLDVSEEVVVGRISGRRVCASCGAIYSVSAPPSNGWTCDKCGGDVVQRADDTEESVRKRLAAYNEQTAPLLAWFAGREMLVTVDGVGDPDEISARIAAAVDARLG